MIDRHEFQNSPSVVADARSFATRRLHGVSTELSRLVGLMVSELATNCVRHTASDFTVEVEQTTRDVYVRVTDRGEGEPVIRSPDASDPHGRGLRLVEKLADSFGVTYEARTKTVWFVVRLDAVNASDAPDERGAEKSGWRRRPVGGARSRGAYGRTSERR
jgi:anti-sigma regulatory factor (Ser/Thr protein kinase)